MTAIPNEQPTCISTEPTPSSMGSMNVLQQVLVAGLSKFVLTPLQIIEACIDFQLQVEDVRRLL